MHAFLAFKEPIQVSRSLPDLYNPYSESGGTLYVYAHKRHYQQMQLILSEFCGLH